jgi:dGTPase
VVVMRAEVTKVVNGLFPLFMADPALLPAEWRHDIDTVQSEVELARIVADYVAGMTDRFALQEGARLLG